jgi:uncharacterized protein YaiI (UPF0178 family)
LTGYRRPKQSAEHRKKLSESKMRCYVVIDPTGQEYTIKNITKFSAIHNIDASNMIRVAQGKQSHHKRWKCRFYNNLRGE